jgi:ribosomal protein S18 acetylase RimI-like enzyme
MQMSDHPQLVKLWEPEDMETDPDYLRAILERNPTTCFVYEAEGQVVAACCGLFNGRHSFLASVAVLPDQRGKGYGKLVVQASMEALSALSSSKIRLRLLVAKGNEQVIPFYEKLGFTIHEVTYMGININIGEK